MNEKQKFCVTFQIFPYINQHNNILTSFQQTTNQKDKSTTIYGSSDPGLESSLKQEVLILNFFYLRCDMDNINTMIFTCLMMFWMRRCRVRETYLKPRACVWDLSCCLQIFWSQQEQRKRKYQVLLLQGKNKGFGFLFGNSGFSTKVSQFSFLSFDNSLSLSPKTSPLNVWWSKVFIDEFVGILGVKQKGFEPILASCSFAFSSQFSYASWCNYGMQA